MALNVGRWLRYAQAKVNDAVRSTEQDLARREAAREVEQADKPWLGDDARAPSLETTRARIAWEAEQAEGAQRERSRAAEPEVADDGGTGGAEAAQARIELDQRAADSAARLEAIRRELGVDDPDDDA